MEIDAKIRQRQTKLKRLADDLAKAEAYVNQYQSQLTVAINREAGARKKSANIGLLRKKVSEKRAECDAIKGVIAAHEKKLAELFTEQERQGLKLKIKALLNEAQSRLNDYKRCETLKQDFNHLLYQIASERDHILRRFIRLVEIEGVEALRKAGLDFEGLQNEWRSVALTLFDYDINQRLMACTTMRYSLLNELQAVVSGKGKFSRYEAPQTLIQPEPPAGQNMNYEERRKFREKAIRNIHPVKMPTFVVHGDSGRDF